MQIKIKCLILFFFLFCMLDCKAFDDYILTTSGKLSDIKVENKEILDVYPIITIMNEKNNLIIHPQKIGETKFSVRKGEKTYKFNVKISETEVDIQNHEGFEIMILDNPPTILDCDLDLPPTFNEGIDILDLPPKLREVK